MEDEKKEERENIIQRLLVTAWAGGSIGIRIVKAGLMDSIFPKKF